MRIMEAQGERLIDTIKNHLTEEQLKEYEELLQKMEELGMDMEQKISSSRDFMVIYGLEDAYSHFCEERERLEPQPGQEILMGAEAGPSYIQAEAEKLMAAQREVRRQEVERQERERQQLKQQEEKQEEEKQEEEKKKEVEKQENEKKETEKQEKEKTQKLQRGRVLKL